MKTLVGCCFQRTKKPNTHKITPLQKAFLTLSGRLFFLPILLIGALGNAPYGGFIAHKYYNFKGKKS